MLTETRMCKTCGVEKLYIEIEFQRGHWECRACSRIRSRNKRRLLYLDPNYPEIRKTQRALRKEADKETAKRARAERHLKLDQLKSAPCKDCGKMFPPYVMDFDHRDTTTKEFNISAVRQSPKSWNKVLKEIEKCDLVCACCHRLRTWKGPPKWYLSERKKILIKLKSAPCTDCGKTFHYSQMDFDHVKGVKNAPVAKLGGLKATLKEIEKCELVCTNCHRIRTHNRKHPNVNSRIPLSEINMEWKYNKHTGEKRTNVNVNRVKRPSEHKAWHDLIGTVTDSVLAQMVGLTCSTVCARRVKMGISKYIPPKKDPASRPWHALVGTMADQKVAEIGGVTFSRVAAYRRQVGIPAFKNIKPRKKILHVPKSSPKFRVWHSFAGIAPDKEVSERFDISIASVSMFRKRMGITAFRHLQH